VPIFGKVRHDPLGLSFLVLRQLPAPLLSACDFTLLFLRGEPMYVKVCDSWEEFVLG